MMILLIWDNENYRGSLLVLFPCITTPIGSSILVLLTPP
jgi:hypothetical protein